VASFAAASRVDPVNLGAPGPLDLSDLDDGSAAELVKYGEFSAPEDDSRHDLPLVDTAWQKEIDEAAQPQGDDVLFPDDSDIDRFFEAPIEDFPDAGKTPASTGEPLPETDNRFDPETEQPRPGAEMDPGVRDGSVPDSAPVEGARDEPAFSNTYRPYEYGSAPAKSTSPRGVREPGEKTPKIKDLTGMNFRTRYKILDAVSGRHYGTCFGDEGYSTLDPVTIGGLLGGSLEGGEVRIVKLDWSNFDEVEVHIQVDEVIPADPGGDYKKDVEDRESPQEVRSRPAGAPAGGDEEEIRQDEKAEMIEGITDGEEERPENRTGDTSSNMYIIYDRRTIQPMGEFVPEGKRARIDRLTLYRMFPEYDFKTFEIDSIRFESGEVRILIRGEKKGGEGVRAGLAAELQTSNTGSKLMDPKADPVRGRKKERPGRGKAQDEK
jgi:hypothetical protein